MSNLYSVMHPTSDFTNHKPMGGFDSSVAFKPQKTHQYDNKDCPLAKNDSLLQLIKAFHYIPAFSHDRCVQVDHP
jgi:hypothetical protein